MDIGVESSGGWAGVSPRISFSHDLPQADISESTGNGGDRRLDLSLPLDVPASSDFDFSLSTGVFSHDSYLADDLFSDGKLLPLPIKNPSSSSSSSLPSATAADPAAAPSACQRKRGSLREVMANSNEDDAGMGKRSPQKSFWRFRRSSSLNCGGGDGSRSSLCPFPLLRSKSSGSSPMQIRSNVKQCNTSNINTAASLIGKLGNNDASGSSPFTDLFRKGSNESKTRVYYYSGNPRQRSHGNAVRISPILNVPTPTSMGIFSFLLCRRGDKSMAKSSAVTCAP